jgi:hypothetical protein
VPCAPDVPCAPAVPCAPDVPCAPAVPRAPWGQVDADLEARRSLGVYQSGLAQRKSAADKRALADPKAKSKAAKPKAKGKNAEAKSKVTGKNAESAMSQIFGPRLMAACPGAASSSTDGLPVPPQQGVVDAINESAVAKTGPDVVKTGPDEAMDETCADVAKTGPDVAKTGPDEAMDETGPDVAKDETGADEAKDETGADVAKDETGPGVAKDETGPDVAKDETGPDVAKDETGPDVAMGETGPDVAKTGHGSPLRAATPAEMLTACRDAAVTMGEVEIVSENIVKTAVAPEVVSSAAVDVPMATEPGVAAETLAPVLPLTDAQVSRVFFTSVATHKP